MLGRIIIKKGRKDEGEKPFWISYSDLMTAAMTLFLVVMAVTIVTIGGDGKKEKERREAMQTCFDELKTTAKQSYPDAKLDYSTGDAIRIDLGSIVNFDSNQSNISPKGVEFLRAYIPSILKSVKSSACNAYFRRVVVEGYTDTDGDYLTNLQLSLRRSSQVVCSLSANNQNSDIKITKAEQNEIKDLFLVGGFSFNSLKASKAESRRVELKLEFWQLNDKRPTPLDLSNKEFGTCFN
jgi:outer membrane protein OmpA-like peptidoglycan-associated protein